MIFNSFQFIWLFPLIFVAYWIVNRLFAGGGRQIANCLLLIISYGLYAQWSIPYTGILFGVTVITYTFARIIEYNDAYGQKKYLIFSGVFLTLLPLLVFKYYNFITEAGASALAYIGIDTPSPGLDWVVPLGLSFYTFQALGYLCDVYYKQIKAEHNFLDYMLFVAFFPQILCGPISKAEDLLPQIKCKSKFDYSKGVIGLKYLLWGMTLKVCVADRLGIYVDSIYSDYTGSSSISLFIASIAYSFQIYSDFAGYSFMALGTGKLLGYDLIINFNRPYISTSVSEFWKKWNISLTKWLTTYVYIPLGGNRKGRLRMYLNIIITFLVSGVWHGANWTFILWGGIHGIAQCVEKGLGLNKPMKNKLGVSIKIFLTFLIVNFAWIYFRLPSISEGSDVIMKIFELEGSTLKLPENENMIGFIIALGILVFDFLSRNRSPLPKIFFNNNRMLRWSSYLILMATILIFGVFENSAFIYLQF